MPEIRAMCAIGRRGQLGLNGRMPWEGAKGPGYTADIQRFLERTRGHVILLGPRTYRSVAAFAHDDSTVVAIRSTEQPADVIARYPDRVIYIGGEPPVWIAYAPFIRRWDITRLPYDGAADRWFDPAWIVAVRDRFRPDLWRSDRANRHRSLSLLDEPVTIGGAPLTTKLVGK